VTDYSQAIEQLSAPYQRIYEAIYEAAELGKPCPSNRELAALCGIPGAQPSYAAFAVGALERAGLIDVERGQNTRVIVLPSGKRTKTAEPIVTHVRRGNAGRNLAPLTFAVERTTCTYCGVRSDHGCAHSRRYATGA
jgi:DNA-binding transcriptional regulator YhcF (GntR family)